MKSEQMSQKSRSSVRNSYHQVSKTHSKAEKKKRDRLMFDLQLRKEIDNLKVQVKDKRLSN